MDAGAGVVKQKLSNINQSSEDFAYSIFRALGPDFSLKNNFDYY